MNTDIACIAACHTDWQLHSKITCSDTGTAEVLHEVQRQVQVDGQCTWVSICMQLAADYCMNNQRTTSPL